MPIKGSSLFFAAIPAITDSFKYYVHRVVFLTSQTVDIC